MAGPNIPVYVSPESVAAMANAEAAAEAVAGTLNCILYPTAKSLLLTLSSGVGSVAVPDSAKMARVRAPSSATVRVGTAAPEAQGTATGNAALTDLKLGITVPLDENLWIELPPGTNRHFYFYSTVAADTVTVAFFS
jgi:hypothetical protein